MSRGALAILLALALTACPSSGARPAGGAHATASWGTDLPAALAQAKTENKGVLLLFTGTTW